MDTIIETMTFAVILLIIGLVCLVIGVSALMWSARHDRRQAEKRDETARSGEPIDDTLHQPVTW
jgi:Na+-transporting methylmalonyl-CoA/oxaloacetate decarboxylase gamma subunit